MKRGLVALVAIAVLAAVAAVLAGACTPLPTGSRQPKPCAVVYSVARCQAMTDIVAADVGKNRDDVVSVAIVPDAPPGGAHLGAGWHVRVRLALKDGSTYDQEICGGVVHEAGCSDEPRLEIRSPIDAGYQDVPEGSTPLPSVEPSALHAASPITLDRLSIPIERLGEQKVVVGDGSLANGIWTAGTFRFGDTWPADLALRDAHVILELRSLEQDGKPFDNYYIHGWRAGVERVRAVLRFDVLWFKRGAALEINDFNVR